ncbi:thymidylate synthase (FAD), partial [Candidatus Hakubella thermalkaliphila]
PPAIAADSEAEQLFRQQMEQLRQAYQVLCGMVHREDARYLLPNACETKLVFTMNARSLHNFFVTRCCNRAQWEIRLLAETIYQEVKRVAPNLFASAGPACVSQGVCPEGEMTCGEIADVLEKFRKM